MVIMVWQSHLPGEVSPVWWLKMSRIILKMTILKMQWIYWNRFRKTNGICVCRLCKT